MTAVGHWWRAPSTRPPASPCGLLLAAPPPCTTCFHHLLLLLFQEHECLVDFIAVSPEARGKGVGAKLMAWAEETGPRILAQMEAEAVAAHGVEMTLWVRGS